MQNFRYVALGPGGKKVHGELAAASIELAEAQLVQKNLYPTKLETTSSAKATGAAQEKSAPFSRRKKAASVDDVCEMLRALCVMLQSGVPVVEGLQAVAENASAPSIQKLAKGMKADVLSGRSLSQSMAQYPKAFPEVVVDMVSVADESGKLADTLQNVIVYLDRNNTVRKNIVGSLVYPGILMGASGLAFLVLIVVILPTFGEAFSSLGVKLPWFTQALLDLGKFIKGNPLLVIGGLIGLRFGIKKALTYQKVKRAYSLGLLKLPVVGPILTQVALNRSLRTLGSLLRTNVPIIEAITYASRVANHIPLTAAWESVRANVGNGSPIAESMTVTGAFPKMVIQMVAVGERSGRVPDLLETITEHSEQHVERRIKTAVSLLEPLVIVGMGVLVGMITVSILMPLFSINNNLN